MKKFLLPITIYLSVIATAQVGINTEKPDNSAILDAVSTNKGVLFPRIENTASIEKPAEGLIIYNKTEKRLQINIGTPDSPEWRNISVEQIKKSLSADLKCETIAINGTLKKGRALASENLSIKVDVKELATEPTENNYSIEADSPNGYKFSATGTFAQTGEQTITLQGSGTPVNAGTDNLTLTFKDKTCSKGDVVVVDSQPVTKVIGRVGFSNTPSRRMGGSPAYFSPSIDWGMGAYGKSWSAMLYDKELIGTSGTLDAISFLVHGDRPERCTAKTSNQKIYMKLVDEDTFSNKNNEDLSQMIKVFDGEITWVKGSSEESAEKGWTRIKLNTPFEYDNSKNLLIYFVNEFGKEDSCLGSFGGPDFVVDRNGKDSDFILSKYEKYEKVPTGTATDSTYKLPVIKLELN